MRQRTGLGTHIARTTLAFVTQGQFFFQVSAFPMTANYIVFTSAQALSFRTILIPLKTRLFCSSSVLPDDANREHKAPSALHFTSTRSSHLFVTTVQSNAISCQQRTFTRLRMAGDPHHFCWWRLRDVKVFVRHMRNLRTKPGAMPLSRKTRQRPTPLSSCGCHGDRNWRKKCGAYSAPIEAHSSKSAQGGARRHHAHNRVQFLAPARGS